MKSALVFGGTGPTGPYIVNGLLARGYQVTILHSGQHEVAFDHEVEHLHTDPHFRETLEPALAGRRWDLVVASYGRLSLTVELLTGRADRLIAVSGSTGALANPDDPRWGPMGRPNHLDEADGLFEADPRHTFSYRMAQAQRALFDAHRQGRMSCTCIAYPILYGPRQPGALDWCIVRRVLDQRNEFIIADGGIKIEDRAFVENAAHAVLLAVDRPEVAAGKTYLVADRHRYTLRQRIEAVARYMGHRFELIDMPWDQARPCHVLWRRQREYRCRDNSLIRLELGYRDPVGPWEALSQSVDWLVAHRPEPGGELEQQLGDPFDYEREDRLIAHWRRAQADLPPVDYPLPVQAHIYRHPKQPNEGWRRPGGPSS
jgi:nucleoside-diphosphate-sugar epimerase